MALALVKRCLATAEPIGPACFDLNEDDHLDTPPGVARRNYVYFIAPHPHTLAEDFVAVVAQCLYRYLLAPQAYPLCFGHPAAAFRGRVPTLPPSAPFFKDMIEFHHR